MDLTQFEDFTPGPWTLWNNCGGAPAVGVGPTEELEVGVAYDETEQQRANARLIAAAPEIHAHALSLQQQNKALVAENERLREAFEPLIQRLWATDKTVWDRRVRELWEAAEKAMGGKQ